jgi:peptidoglycan/xylan/chitin deacetylase (PgdA/CDA1 family)
MYHLREHLATAACRTGLAHVIMNANARLPSSWQRLTIMTWHRIAADLGCGFDPGVISASPEQFDRQLAVLKEYCSIIDTADLERYRGDGRPLPPNPALLTFDDGYRDNLTMALPILQKHHAKAVFFIATDFMSERKLFWWERISVLVTRSRRREIQLTYPGPLSLSFADADARCQAARRLFRVGKTQPRMDWTLFLNGLAGACEVNWDENMERGLADGLILDWSGVRALVEAGMDVQSHGESHRIFSTISVEEVLREARASREVLEAQTGLRQYALAYPAGRGFALGDAGYRAVEQAGYKLAFRFDKATCRVGRITDWLNIPRLSSTPGMAEERFRGYLAFPNYLA